MKTLLSVLACFLLIAAAGAETLSPAPIERSLDGISPAGESCPIDLAPGTGTPDPGRTRGGKVDVGCAISAAQALSLIENPLMVLLDTRPAGDFNTYHINGAQNYPVSQLKHQPLSKDRPVVLVGDGKTDRELYQDCGTLKAAGFKSVKVLQGGMLSWLAERLPVLGGAPEAAELALLSPQELYRAAGSGQNLLLLAPGTKDMGQWFESGVGLSDTSPQALKAKVDLLRSTLGSHKAMGVVLIAGESYGIDLIAPALELLKPTPLLVYRGTSAEYDSFLAAQKATWAAQARGPKKPPCSL